MVREVTLQDRLDSVRDRSDLMRRQFLALGNPTVEHVTASTTVTMLALLNQSLMQQDELLYVLQTLLNVLRHPNTAELE